MNVLWERTKMIPRGGRGLYPPPRVGGWKGGSCQQEQESRILQCCPSSQGVKERGCGFHVAVGLYLEACSSRVAEGYCGGRHAAGL